MEKRFKRGRPLKSAYQREGLLKTLMDEYDVTLLPDRGSKVNVFREGLNYVTSFDLIKDGDFYKYQYSQTEWLITCELKKMELRLTLTRR